MGKLIIFSDHYTVSSLVRFYRGNNFEALCTSDLMDPKCPCQYLTWMFFFRNSPSSYRSLRCIESITHPRTYSSIPISWIAGQGRVRIVTANCQSRQSSEPPMMRLGGLYLTMWHWNYNHNASVARLRMKLCRPEYYVLWDFY